MVKTKFTKRKKLSDCEDEGKNDERATHKQRKTEINQEPVIVDNSVFGELVTAAGIILKGGNKPNELNQDKAVFQKKLTKLLERHLSYPEVIDEFVEKLLSHLEDPARFRWSLMPCIVQINDEMSACSGTTDSMIKLLLGVDILQPKIMAALLEKLAEMSGEEEEVIFDDVEKVNFPRLIMYQFRWLDKIVNSQELIEKMFEILTVTSIAVQREIISCIPEVIDDTQHSDVAKQLREMLLESNELTVPVLDAFTNMSLTPELLSEVRSSVLQTLHSVSFSDVPVIVKFLLQTVSPSDALEVIQQLRAELDFSIRLPTKSKTKGHSKGKQVDKAADHNVEALTIDAIRSAIRFQKFVAEAWIKAVESVKSTADHKPLDIIVLLILHSNNYKRSVESLIRNKIRSGKFSETLLQLTFSRHSDVLRDYFTSVLSLAEVLLRSAEPNIRYFASCIYKYGFQSFDVYCQQEIVSNLVTHIGSGLEIEIDASFNILLDLSHKDFSRMSPFVVFIKCILDYMDNLSISQIRKLYSILSFLTFKNLKQDNMIQDELHILIRKQLSHKDIRYKRMGVIGAIMIIQSIATSISSSEEDTQEDSLMSDECYKQVINLLELVKASCSQSSEAVALFMDELAIVVHSGRLNGKVESWIAENVTSDFLDNFVVDIDPEKKIGCDILPWKTSYGLDDESDNSIVINLVPMLAKDYPEKKQKGLTKNITRCLSLCLSPNFRLLQVCESRQNNGDLTGIDALLGCPLYVVDEQIFNKISSLGNREKELLTDSLFLTVNWFIQLLNAFGSCENTEMKGKIIARLHDITNLRKTLERILPEVPDYTPPPANFDLDNIQPPAALKPPSQTKKTMKTQKKKKQVSKENVKDDSDESRDSTVMDKTSQKTMLQAEESPAECSKSVVDIDTYSPFFREMDMTVFDILKVGLITKAALDTEMNTKATTVLQIQPPQLEFLLKDLVRKTDHVLTATPRNTFFKAKPENNVGFSHIDYLSPVQVCSQLVSLLPSLCDQLENTSAFFQSLQATNDGLIDGPGFNSEESQLMDSCFQLTLKVILNLLSWSGFQMSEYHSLQKQVLSVLYARLNSTASSHLSSKELCRQAFLYFEHFSASVPSLGTAVTLCNVLLVLTITTDLPDLGEKLGVLCAEFLKRDWINLGTEHKGVKHNERLNTLLRLFLDNSSDLLASLEDLATVAVPELIESDNGFSTKYPTLTKNSFPVFYKVMLAQLVAVVKSIQTCKASDCDEVKMERMCEWHIAIRIFYILVNLIKKFDGRSNLNALLKYGRQFVDVFLRQLMPTLDETFRHHKDDVISLIKNLQLSTRALQHLCGHSKILRDISLTNQVPLMKKVLEVFVYRVKAMLTMNKCLEAFWLGNLKNRDIRGEEIVSQSTSVGDSNQDDNEEELPEEEEEESEVELDKESKSERETGASSDEEEDSYSVTY